MAIQKLKEQEKEKKSSSSFKEQVEAIISKPVTKKVRLKYRSSCGCGSSVVTIEREVAYDSHYENGDYIDELLDDDVVLY